MELSKVTHRVATRAAHFAHHKMATHGTLLGSVVYGLLHEHAGIADWSFLILAVLVEIEPFLNREV